MERERLDREKEENEKAESMKKVKEQFDDPSSQWEKDKDVIANEALKEKEKKDKEKEKENAEGKEGDGAAKAVDSKTEENKPKDKVSTP